MPMRRREKWKPWQQLLVEVSPQMMAGLERLASTGLYGRSAAQVAERLIARELELLRRAESRVG